MKRTLRNLPSLTPFMIGAAVGMFMNRRDTGNLAEKIRKDLRRRPDSLGRPPRLRAPHPAGRQTGRDGPSPMRAAGPRPPRAPLRRVKPSDQARTAVSAATRALGSRVERYAYGVGSWGSVISTRTAVRT